MIKAAILAGNDNPQLNRLVQLLHDHPDVELMCYTDDESAGKTLDELYPALTGETELEVTQSLNTDKIDIVFLVCDAEKAAKFIEETALPDNICIIDMSGHFRNSDDSRFVQGIPELNRKAMVRGARFVAMPDAATTAVALALLPLAKNLLLKNVITTAIVVDNPDAEPETLTNSRLSEETSRSLDTALKTLQPAMDAAIKGVVFKGDIPEGLMAVTTVDADMDIDELRRLYEEFYDDHNFTFIVDNVPDINDVRDTNKSFIHLDKAQDKLLITSVLDTDMKGGAGNAVHAMNLLFGLIEKVGL